MGNNRIGMEHVGKLRRVVVTPDGEVKRISGSTARLTSPEMEEYLMKIRVWAAQVLGIHIPEPNENLTPPIDAY